MNVPLDDRPARVRPWTIAFWLTQPVVIGALLFVALGGPRRDFHVPITFDGDGLYYLVQSKTTLDYGWWWTNPSMSAPAEYDALAFAQSSTVDQAIVWIIGRATSDPALVVTLAWIAMVMLSGATATWCLRRLGASPGGAWVCGILFAFSPYAFYRGTSHFNLAIHLIPFPAAAAIFLASGALSGPRRQRLPLGFLAGCALTGFNFIYYVAFGACAIAGGTLLGWARGGRRVVVGAGVALLAAMVLATGLNLLPTVMAWRRDGTPTSIRGKAPREAELYGLKIRQLVSPLPNHWFPPFQAWVTKERKAAFPLETENTSSRLGVVPAIGFVGLLAILLMPALAGRGREVDGRIHAAAVLTFGAVVIATIGGLGGLFNLLVAPDIRAYTRVTPFLSFFALTGLALWIDLRVERRRVKAAIWTTLLVLGVSDQLVAAHVLVESREGTARQYHQTQALVSRLETTLPANAMVLQLPFAEFPAYGDETMPGYEHFRPYVVSHTLRWSYPALSNARLRWQQRMAAVEIADLPRQAADQRFAAILLDRRGYDDNGASTIATLRQSLGDHAVIVEDERYVAFDLRPLAGVSPQ